MGLRELIKDLFIKEITVTEGLKVAVVNKEYYWFSSDREKYENKIDAYSTLAKYPLNKLKFRRVAKGKMGKLEESLIANDAIKRGYDDEYYGKKRFH